MISAVLLAFVVLLALCGVGTAIYGALNYIDSPKTIKRACCPPGLGCNDPDQTRNGCYRALAYRMATTQQGAVLDRTWSAYQGAAWYSPLERHIAAVKFGQVRDGIIQMKMNEISDNLQQQRQLASGDEDDVELPSHYEVMQRLQNPSDVRTSYRGEVV